MTTKFRIIVTYLSCLLSGNVFGAPVLYTVEGVVSGIYGNGPSVDGLGLSFGDEVTYRFIIDTERSGFIDSGDGSIQYVEDEVTNDWSYVRFYAELIDISYTVSETYYNWGFTNYFAENIDNPAYSTLLGSVVVGPDKLYLNSSSYVEDWQLGDAFGSAHWWHDPESDEFITLNTQLSLTEITAVPLPSAIWLFGSGLLGLIGMARCNKAV